MQIDGAFETVERPWARTVLPSTTIDVSDIARRPLLGEDPRDWEPEPLNGMELPADGLLFEIDSYHGVWLDTGRGRAGTSPAMARSDGMSLQLFPVVRDQNYVSVSSWGMVAAYIVDADQGESFSREEVEQRTTAAIERGDPLQWAGIGRYYERQVDQIQQITEMRRVDEVDRETVHMVWACFACLMMYSADGVLVKTRETQPVKWKKRYQERNGESPSERVKVAFADRPMDEKESSVCLHYTRGHVRRLKDRTVSVRGYWSGNPELGISLRSDVVRCRESTTEEE